MYVCLGYNRVTGKWNRTYQLMECDMDPVHVCCDQWVKPEWTVRVVSE